MLNNTLLTQTALLTANNVTTFFQMDPLEQFDVLAVSFPIVGNIGFTNLALLLALNVAVMAS
jgi:hypothetical protein